MPWGNGDYETWNIAGDDGGTATGNNDRGNSSSHPGMNSASKDSIMGTMTIPTEPDDEDE